MSASRLRPTTSVYSPSPCAVRGVIQFFTAQGYPAIAIHRQLKTVYGDNVMKARNVRKWVNAFKEGRQEIHDKPRSPLGPKQNPPRRFSTQG